MVCTTIKDIYVREYIQTDRWVRTHIVMCLIRASIFRWQAKRTKIINTKFDKMSHYLSDKFNKFMFGESALFTRQLKFEIETNHFDKMRWNFALYFTLNKSNRKVIKIRSVYVKSMTHYVRTNQVCGRLTWSKRNVEWKGEKNDQIKLTKMQRKRKISLSRCKCNLIFHLRIFDSPSCVLGEL